MMTATTTPTPATLATWPEIRMLGQTMAAILRAGVAHLPNPKGAREKADAQYRAMSYIGVWETGIAATDGHTGLTIALPGWSYDSVQGPPAVLISRDQAIALAKLASKASDQILALQLSPTAWLSFEDGDDQLITPTSYDLRQGFPRVWHRQIQPPTVETSRGDDGELVCAMTPAHFDVRLLARCAESLELLCFGGAKSLHAVRVQMGANEWSPTRFDLDKERALDPIQGARAVVMPCHT